MSEMRVVDESQPALDQKVVLRTVHGSQIPLHLAKNSRCRDCHQIVLWLPVRDVFGGDYQDPREACHCQPPNPLPTITQSGTKAGKTLAICGAGPSLAEGYKIARQADEVWGCNRAANWLVERNWPVTHALAIDAGPAMYEDAWAAPPDVPDYLIATSVDPLLVDHLLAHDKRLTFFHSIRGGVVDELDWLRIFYHPGTPIVGRGLNVVTRGLELADWLGYDRIYLLGADHAFAPRDDAMYVAGGGKREDDAIVEGDVNGRVYRTKPDMLMCAVTLAEYKARIGDRLEFVGAHSLPRALYLAEKREPGYLRRCIRYAEEYEAEFVAGGAA